MKPRLFLLRGSRIAASLAAASAGLLAFGQSPVASNGSGRILIEAHTEQPEAPLFFSASAEQTITVTHDAIKGEARLTVRILQGNPEVLSLALHGSGEVTSVAGTGLRDWAIRQGSGERAGMRFLDLHPTLAAKGEGPKELTVVVETALNQPKVPGSTELLLIGKGDAVAFASTTTLQRSSSVTFQVTSVSGMLSNDTAQTATGSVQYSSTTGGRITIALSERGAVLPEAELADVRLEGRVDEAVHSVDFQLTGSLTARKIGASVRLLSGRAALADRAAGDGWHVVVRGEGEEYGYFLVADRAGTLPVALHFNAAIGEDTDWRKLEFGIPASAVVPIRLQGLAPEVEFSAAESVVPALSGGAWQGFLPASGWATLAWKHARATKDAALFFTSAELTEVRVGAGLLRQETQLTFRVMQGKLPGLRLRLAGPGEILGVAGANIVGWNVAPDATGGGRVLDVRLSRPLESEGELTLRSQSVLGAFPVKAEPLRIVPEGSTRHSGAVRVANNGAVRLEVTDVSGMIQLPPAQFGGPPIENAQQQVFVYRFPSGSYDYRVAASQIQAEVGVSQIVSYELTDTDRVINADIELDIREASLNEWSLRIPADYAVVSLTGANISDSIAESAANNGSRVLKVLFGQPAEGRQLLKLRLEKNQAAAAGEWRLPRLEYPSVKYVRGYVAALSTPGYRFTPASLEQLVEIPTSFFPRQSPGLQQAWRVRDASWTGVLHVASLSQSVQVDAYHLYSLKEGVVYGSVLLNYFVVGAPASEWRIAIPRSLGNVDITGQNVRRDWRREGDDVIVSLHQPVLGPASLLVTFEQTLSARGGSIHPGEVRPLAVQGERGFVQVVSPVQVKHSVVKAEGGLLKLEPMELPAELRLLNTAPSLAVYQYTGRPFDLEMAVESSPQAEMVEQVVDFAQLSSRVSRDGQVATDATFFVKTRRQQVLRVGLAPGVSLWEARVGGEIVTAQREGDLILVPLPAKLNPNDPVSVVLRLGQVATGDGKRVHLTAPKLQVPVVVDEWTVHADDGRVLVPAGGNIAPLRQPLTQSGFEWLIRRGWNSVFVLAALGVLSGLLLRGSNRWRSVAALVAQALAIVLALGFALDSLGAQRSTLGELVFSATARRLADPMTIELLNQPIARAGFSWWGLVIALVGVALLVVPPRPLRGWRTVAGFVLVSAGALAQRPGAAWFFVVVAFGFVALTVSTLVGLLRMRRPPAPVVPGTSAGPAAATSLLVLFAGMALGVGAGSKARAESPAVVVPASEAHPIESITEVWRLHDGRVFAEADFVVRGTAGQTVLLARPPAVLTDFKGAGMRVTKLRQTEESAYYLVLDRDGPLTGHASYEMPAPKLTEPLPIPTGVAALRRLTLDLDQDGWDITSASAVEVRPAPGLAAGHSGATLTLAPENEAEIELKPRQRNLAGEKTEFFAETANVYLPAPGVVNGYARITVRPSQGQVSELTIAVPKGLTVGEVGYGPVGTWRFDPEKHLLHVAITPVQTSTFSVVVETQLGTGPLPFDASLEPLRVAQAVGDVGMIALAFESEAQSEGVRTTGLTPVSVMDFDAQLVPKKGAGSAATVQQVWRYGREDAKVELKVAPVAPEVRLASRQLFTIDDDRLVAAIDLQVAITRGGVFNLSFEIPAGLDVEGLSGPALNHWAESNEGGHRIVTLYLNGRTMGEQHFTLALAGAAPRAQDGWAVPRIALREATRHTGELVLVPGKGIRLRAVDRQNVTPIDPRSIGANQPGALGFRLLQDAWEVRLGIETLDAWITAQALEDLNVREGQTLTRVSVRLHVENAAVKQARVRLPNLTDEQSRTVHATGPAITDFVKVAGEPDVWEARFQRAIVGETEFIVEFQTATAENGAALSVPAVAFPGARQTTLFVALRSGERLELAPADTPHGWNRSDWASVPPTLHHESDPTVPALCYRVADPEGPLQVGLRRHEAANAAKLRVSKGELTTLFSPAGTSLTGIDLTVQLVEKTTLHMRLPAHAELFNVFVNGDSVAVVRQGDDCLFYVSPNSANEQSATVRLVYALSVGDDRSRVTLAGPSVGVPLENVSWKVVLPAGVELKRYQSALQLREQRAAGSFGLGEYQALVSSVHNVEAKKATALFDQANALVQRGDQLQASEVLSRAVKNTALDQAANEDARVQLRELKTQQALVGLNTRRQRMYLDNRAEGLRNEQLEQAARVNPFMQGKTTFDPQQLDQLLMGNSVEETATLRAIATHLVEQQLAAEPAPSAIDITLPERGRLLTFARSLQVDGSAPLSLTLDLAEVNRPHVLVFAALLCGLGVAVRFSLPARKR